MKYKKQNFLSRLISGFILLTFLTGQILTPPIVSAQVLSVPGTMLGSAVIYTPPVLLGLKVHPENPLLFDFIVDRGSANLSDEEFKTETEKLVKYFLAALTIPDKEVWVNLSPYEKDRIIPDVLSRTQIGKTMLEQDYMLKQLAASLTNPETDLGKTYWGQIHKVETVDAGRSALGKATNLEPLIPSLLNKVWIIPAKAKVLESNGIVVVDEKRLKVMMAEDIQQVNIRNGRDRPLQTETSTIFRSTILPNIEKEVNEGKDFAAVRQVYNSVILAAWYKQALKESLLGRVYADQAKVAGVEIDDKDMKERVYAQYVQAFKKGAYNFIKEEEDASGELIPRKYFSGGIEVAKFGQVAGSALEVQVVSSAAVEKPIRLASSATLVTVQGEELASAAVIKGNLLTQNLSNEFESELAASSALSNYLLPVEDGLTRDAVKVLARKLFALPEVIGGREIEDFRILWESTDVNSSIGVRLRSLNNSSQSMATQTIAETLIIMQSEYPAIFSAAEQIDDILQEFWAYSLNFESLEEVMRQEDSLSSVRLLAVRQITSLLVLNENYLNFVFEYADRLKQYQNLLEEPSRINEYLDGERDFFPAMTSTIENIRLGLSAEFLDSKDLDGFANIMQDVSIFLKSLMAQQAIYMITHSGDIPSASSGVQMLIPTAAQLPLVEELQILNHRLDLNGEWSSLTTDQANEILERAIAILDKFGNPDNIQLPNNGGNINRYEILGKRDVIDQEMKIRAINQAGGRPFIPAGKWFAPNFEVAQGEVSDLYWGHIASYDELYSIIMQDAGMLKANSRHFDLSFYSSGQGHMAQVRKKNGHAGIVPLIFTKKGFSDYGIGLVTGLGVSTLGFNQSVPLRLLAPYSKTFAWQAILTEIETRSEELTEQSKAKIARALGYLNYSDLEKNLSPLLEELNQRIAQWSASSALSQYVLPITDPNIRDAVKEMAKEFFASSDYITNIEFQNFRLAVTWSNANDNPGSLVRDLITPLLFNKDSSNGKIAKVIADVYKLYPVVLSSKDNLFAVLEGFEAYMQHFQEIKRYDIENDKFRASHFVVVRFMASEMLLNDVDLAKFQNLAELLIVTSQNVNNVYGIDEGKFRSVFDSLEQVRLQKQDDNSRSILDIIDESLSSDFKGSEERGEFVSILKNVQQFLFSKSLEAGQIQGPGSVNASSTVKSAQIDKAANRVMATLQQTTGFWTGILQSSVGAEQSLTKLIKVLLTKALPNSNISNPTVVQVNQWVREAGISGDLKNGFSTAESFLSTQEIMVQYLGYQFENNAVSVVSPVILNEITGLVNAASSTVSSSAVGGINFDPTLLNLQIKRNGQGVPLPLLQQNIEQINIQGLYPIIINIQPVNAQTLPLLFSRATEKSHQFPLVSTRNIN